MVKKVLKKQHIDFYCVSIGPSLWRAGWKLAVSIVEVTSHNRPLKFHSKIGKVNLT
jgi:hypothetical protein